MRPAIQERSREKFERLLRAGRVLLERHGFDGMRVADVTREAGCPVSTFYQRFKDKDAFLAVMQIHANEMLRRNLAEERFFENLRGASSDELARAIVTRFIKGYITGEALIRELLRRSGSNPEIKKPLVELAHYLRDGLVEALRPRFAEFSHPNPELALAMALEAFFGILGNILMYDGAPAGLRDPRLAEEMTRIFNSYVGIQAPAFGRGVSRSSARKTARGGK